MGSLTFCEPNLLYGPQFPNLQIVQDQTRAMGPVAFTYSRCPGGDGCKHVAHGSVELKKIEGRHKRLIFLPRAKLDF